MSCVLRELTSGPLSFFSYHNLLTARSSMSEAWDLISKITEVIGMVAVPFFTWVIYTLVQQGKQIIVLEQKVNDSLNQRLGNLEKRVVSVEEKVDEIGENMMECRMLINDTKNMHSTINTKFDVIISKLDK